MISHPLFWIYLFCLFHILVYLTNRIVIRPHLGASEILWTFFFLTVLTSPSFLLSEAWDFTLNGLKTLPLYWSVFLGAVSVFVTLLYLDHAWWLLFRKKP